MTKAPPAKRPRMVSPWAVLHLTVTLADFRLIIWRELAVSSTSTLQELHEIIQVAMGWTNAHLYEFEIDGQTYRAPYVEIEYEDEDFKNAAAVPLRELGIRTGSRFTYEYDFGDSWMHEIVVERVERADPLVFYPRCAGGARAVPPEDSGGAGGFEDVLTALSDPAHPEHDESRTWVGDDYDPTRFDQDAVNVRLAAWWARHMFFMVIGGRAGLLPTDQLEWLALADMENRCPHPPWLD